jgi:hypothetical protein
LAQELWKNFMVTNEIEKALENLKSGAKVVPL